MRCGLQSLVIVFCVWSFTGCEEQSQEVAPAPQLSRTDAVEEEPAIVPAKKRDFFQEMLIDEAQAVWPDPLPALEWKDSLEEGWEQVQEEGRPMFILLHCPGSQSSGTFYEQLLNPTGELLEVLRQYVTVSLTNANDIDLSRMPFEGFQDPDQTWWCWVLSPQGQVYSVLGKEHPERPDATESEVAEWLTSILNHHWDPRRADWAADGPVVPAEASLVSFESNPAYSEWKKGAEYLGNYRQQQNCICSHQAQDILWCKKKLDGKFRAGSHYWIWPPIENYGYIFHHFANSKVANVLAKNNNDPIHIQAGDEIGVIDGKRVFSTTDVRCALKRFRNAAQIHFARGEEVIAMVLESFSSDVRKYDLTWRRSIEESVLSSHPGFLPEPISNKLREKLGLQNKMALVPKVGKGSPAWTAGLRPNQVIVKLGVLEEDFTPRQFLFAFKMTEVGQTASVTVRLASGGAASRVLYLPAISILDLPPEAIQMMKELD